MATINKFVWIGFGSIATTLMELFNIEGEYYDIPNIIIEPKFIAHPELFDGRDVKHIQTELTRDNHKRLLRDIDDKTLIIDLSVNVDSIMLLEWAKKKGSYYINTSIENYEDAPKAHGEPLTYNDIKANTLYHRELLAEAVMAGTNKSRFLNCGFNPGCIQAFFKRGIREYAKAKGVKMIKGDYARLSHELGLKEVFIAEYDSQKTNIKPTKTKFINTWSCIGYELEAADECMLSLNNEDIAGMESMGIHLIKPDEGNAHNIRFLADRGMNVKRKCMTLDHDGNPFEYEGMLIPHAEICSLSEFLQYKGNAPSIMYIYRSSDASIQSLDYLRKNNYKELPDYHVLELDEIHAGGWDSIGALMTFENGDKVWCGSVLSVEDVKKLGFKIGSPTGVQVAGFLDACIKYIIKHPKEGLNESETLHHKELFETADKYMGNIFCKMI
jgi:homospermidine synthase